MISARLSQDTGPEDNPHWEIFVIQWETKGEAKRMLRDWFQEHNLPEPTLIKWGEDGNPFSYLEHDLLPDFSPPYWP